MVAREDTISWGENKPIFRYFLATQRPGNRLIEIPIQFCIIPGKFGKGFARPRILGTRAKKWGESMRPPSPLCIDPLKKNSYKKNFEKKKILKKKKKEKKTLFFSNFFFLKKIYLSVCLSVCVTDSDRPTAQQTYIILLGAAK